MEALRESGTASRKPLRMRNIVGGALGLVGAVLFFVGLFADLPKPYIYVGLGAVLLILGATLLAAQVLVPLAYGIRGGLTRLFGIDGKLAANNIHREPRRSANTAAALMIGVTLLALAATFTQSLKATILDAFETSDADMYAIATATFIPQGAVDIINDTEGVEWAGREGQAVVEYDGEDTNVWVLDADVLGGVYKDQAGDRDLSELGDGVWVTESLMGTDLAVGDEITITGPASEQTLEITGVASDAIGSPLLVNWETGEELVGSVDIVQLSINVADGYEVADVQAAIEEELATDYPLVQLQSVDDIAKFAQQFVDFFLNIITAMLGAALIIAILGVANTLLLSVTERTREIGLLRAVGVRRSSIWRMVTLESVVMALFGTVLGMILGVSIGSALVISLKDLGITGFAIPWWNLLIYTVVAIAAGILAALWPALRAAKLDILKAIAADG
jgi:putative ABC transport system permease protein